MATSAATSPEIELFERFAGSLRLENGRAMRIEPFQREILSSYFDGAREIVCLLPKSNGKSSLLAVLALFEVMVSPDAEIIIVAAARDQAGVMLRQAAGLVRRSDALRTRLVVKQREITHAELGGRIRILASEVDTLDGVIPSLVLLDELHRHKRAELYSILRASLGKRDGRMMVISTAGDDEESPLGQLRTRAYALPVQKRDGAYRHAASLDGAFCLHEWALDAGQDLDDLALVKSANPLSTVTIDQLRERHDSPSTTSWAWARFTCGAWVRGQYSAIEPSEWDQLSVPGTVIPDGSPVWIGWDHAWRGGGDTCAILPLWWAADDRRVIGDPFVLEVPDGEVLDDRRVVEVFETVRSRWRVQGVVFDPSAGAWALAQQISRNTGLQLIEASQRDGPMALADGRLLEAIRRRQLVHSGNPVLRAHVLNAVSKSVQGELFRFTRPKHGPRVPTDALSALSMCHSTALSEASAPKQSRDWFMF